MHLNTFPWAAKASVCCLALYLPELAYIGWLGLMVLYLRKNQPVHRAQAQALLASGQVKPFLDRLGLEWLYVLLLMTIAAASVDALVRLTDEGDLRQLSRAFDLVASLQPFRPMYSKIAANVSAQGDYRASAAVFLVGYLLVVLPTIHLTIRSNRICETLGSLIERIRFNVIPNARGVWLIYMLVGLMIFSAAFLYWDAYYSDFQVKELSRFAAYARFGGIISVIKIILIVWSLIGLGAMCMALAFGRFSKP